MPQTSSLRRRPNHRPVLGVLSTQSLYQGATLEPKAGLILEGIRAASKANNCNLIIGSGIDCAAWGTSQFEQAFVPIGPANVDGIVVLGDGLKQGATAFQVHAGFPLVTTFPEHTCLSVSVDAHEAIHQAVTHLLSRGHVHIRFLTRSVRATSLEAAYCEAFKSLASNLANDACSFGIMHVESNEEAAEAAYRAFMADQRITGVIGTDDVLALGALQAMRTLGLIAPEHIAVLSMDETPASVAHRPALGAMRHPSFDIGYRATAELANWVKGGQPSSQAIRIPPILIVRESCGYSFKNVSDIYGFNGSHALEKRESDIQQAMAQLALSSTWQPGRANALRWAADLWQAFQRSVARRDYAPFMLKVGELINFAESRSIQPDPWNWALSFLRSQALRNHADSAADEPSLRNFVTQLIDWAQCRLTENSLGAHAKRQLEREAITGRTAVLTSRLLTKMSQEEILTVLERELPSVGIARAHIALFSGDSDNRFDSCTCLTQSDGGERLSSWDLPGRFLGDSASNQELMLLPLRIDDTEQGFVIFESDSFEHCGWIARHLEAALRTSRAYSAAEDAKKLAEEAQRTQARFLSTISHELKTPLNLITSLSDLLLRGSQDLPQQTQQDIRRVHANSQHLGRLIGDVLDLASRDAGRLRLALEVVDIRALINEISFVAQQLVVERGLSWCADVPPSLPNIKGDRTRLSQILMNLISNAAKFTPRGRVRLSAGVLETGAGVRVWIEVSDTGIGISPQEQPFIFQEFHRSSQTTEQGYPGLGLGLSICQHLVELHGGDIGVRSSGASGEGATFRISFPAWLTETTAVVASPHVIGNTQLERQPNPFSVVVADDDPLMRELYLRVLQDFAPPLRVLVAHNGEEALALIDSTVGLVILDLMMPGMNGFEALQALRESDLSCDVPIIILTAQPLLEHEMSRLDRGNVTILSKGMFGNDELMAHVASAISRHQRLSTSAQSAVRKALAYIHEHFANELSRAKLAHHVGLTEGYLTRCFHQELGISPVVYINRYRIKQARALLRERHMTVTQAALAVGFSNSAHFSRVFHEIVGVSPKAFQQGRQVTLPTP